MGEKRRVMMWALGAPGSGKARVAQQGFSSPYSCSQDPAGATGILGQVGHRVALGGAMNGDTEGEAFSQCHLLSDRVCISDEVLPQLAKTASRSSPLASSFPLTS